MFKKACYTILATLCVFTIFSITGCKSPIETRQQEKILRIGISYDPLSMDPRCAYLKKDVSIAKALYEGLVRECIDHQVLLGSADHYTISDDGKTYTFYLKKAHWSNGDPLTAYDFEASLKQIHEKQFPITYHRLIYSIKNSQAIIENNAPIEQLGIRSLDDTTLEITLEHPADDFLEVLSNPLFFPVHASLRDSYTQSSPSLLPISNGPFALEDFQPQKLLTLKKNPHYHDISKVHLDQIVFTVLTDARTASKCFANHMIDILGNPWIAKIPREIFNNSPEDMRHIHTMCATSMIIYNVQQPILQNKNLRKAINYSIDRESLLSLINSGRVATSFLPPELSKLTRQEHLTKEEREIKAQHYFAEARKTVSPTDLAKLSIIYPKESAVYGLVAEAIQQQIKDILHIHIPIQGIEYGCFVEKRQKGDFYLSLGGWIAEYLHPKNFLTTLKTPENKETSNQIGKWNHPKYDQLLRKYATLTFNMHDQRLAEELIEEESPVFPLYHSNQVSLFHPRIKNLYFSPLGHVDLKEADIFPEKK